MKHGTTDATSMLLFYFQPLVLFIGRGNMVEFPNATDGNSSCKILYLLDFVNKRRDGGTPNTKAIIDLPKDKWLNYDNSRFLCLNRNLCY